MEELHKLWKYHAAHPRELCQRNEYTDQQIKKNNTKFEIGQPFMITNHACHTIEPEYLLHYKVLKIINDSILLLIIANGKERKTIINDVIPCSTTEVVENAWNSFLDSIKTKCQNYSYKLRPQP